MSFDYARPNATAIRLIDRFGQTATIIRDGVADESDYANISAAVPTRETCTAVLTDFSMSERATGLIESGDVKLLISTHGLSAAPETANRVQVGGNIYNVVNVMPLRPGGVDIMYTVQARGT